MPRSASDATRFTATGPYASAKPAATSSSSLNYGRPAPPGETPQQKIARLRAAAALARQGKESNFDRVVRVGRVWADRAHRLTAWSLIGLTVASGIVASFAIGDMMIHNRKKRKEWLAEKQRESAVLLEEARRAEAAGTANEDQMLVINQDRAAQEAKTARENKKGIFARAKESLYGSLSEEETKGGNLGAGAREAQETLTGRGEGLGIVKAVEERTESLKEGVQTRTEGLKEDVRARTENLKHGFEAGVGAVKEQSRAGRVLEETVHPAGGPLDREAQRAVDAVAQTTKSWTSWLRRT